MKECEGEGKRREARDESKRTLRIKQTGCADLFDIFLLPKQDRYRFGIGSQWLASLQWQQKSQFLNHDFMRSVDFDFFFFFEPTNKMCKANVHR